MSFPGAQLIHAKAGGLIKAIFLGPARDRRPLQADQQTTEIINNESMRVRSKPAHLLIDIPAGQEQQVSRSCWCTAQFPIILIYVGSEEPCTRKRKLKHV